MATSKPVIAEMAAEEVQAEENTTEVAAGETKKRQRKRGEATKKMDVEGSSSINAPLLPFSGEGKSSTSSTTSTMTKQEKILEDQLNAVHIATVPASEN